jgi:hypothetical protein
MWAKARRRMAGYFKCAQQKSDAEVTRCPTLPHRECKEAWLPLLGGGSGRFGVALERRLCGLARRVVRLC